jgi:phosphohistidine swiveling domain-containing protein
MSRDLSYAASSSAVTVALDQASDPGRCGHKAATLAMLRNLGFDRLHTLRAGEVLVCPTTSAAWMMVFRRAGAIVADTGSVLSHTAIVAREFALPAVVAAANATSSLVDGEEVTVDGTRGVVTRN